MFLPKRSQVDTMPRTFALPRKLGTVQKLAKDPALGEIETDVLTAVGDVADVEITAEKEDDAVLTAEIVLIAQTEIGDVTTVSDAMCLA